MVLVTSGWFSGIRSVHVGDPRAHGQERIPNCRSSHRFPGLASFTVVHSEDEQVGNSVRLGNVFQCSGDSVFATEPDPELEDFVARGNSFWDFVGAGELHRSRQSLLESSCGLRGSNCHPLACG